jgi:hypothetical protein
VRRLDTAGLLALGEKLGEAERALLVVVGRLRLMSHAQLAALLRLNEIDGNTTSPISAARHARRVLQRLTELGLLARLDRRIGGQRAGSSGYCYYAGPAGQRLLAYWQGQGLVRGRYRPDPALRYMSHRLAVSQIYVDLRQAVEAGELELLAFDVEPDCWRTHDTGFGGTVVVKPDAFVRLGIGAYEDRAVVEVDLGTESRTVIARKLRVYTAYYKSGQEQAAHGVFPRVVLLTNSEERKVVLVDVCSRLPAEDWHLFSVGMLGDSVRMLRGELGDQDEAEARAIEVAS